MFIPSSILFCCWLTDVGEPNLAKGPKMSWPGHDFTEANFQARGVGSACDVAENQVQEPNLIFFRQRVPNLDLVVTHSNIAENPSQGVFKELTRLGSIRSEATGYSYLIDDLTSSLVWTPSFFCKNCRG